MISEYTALTSNCPSEWMMMSLLLRNSNDIIMHSRALEHKYPS